VLFSCGRIQGTLKKLEIYSQTFHYEHPATFVFTVFWGSKEKMFAVVVVVFLNARFILKQNIQLRAWWWRPVRFMSGHEWSLQGTLEVLHKQVIRTRQQSNHLREESCFKEISRWNRVIHKNYEKQRRRIRRILQWSAEWNGIGYLVSGSYFHLGIAKRWVQRESIVHEWLSYQSWDPLRRQHDKG